jgi:hypothetical protein
MNVQSGYARYIYIKHNKGTEIENKECKGKKRGRKKEDRMRNDK